MSGGGSPCRPRCCARLPSAPHPPASALLGGWVLSGSVLKLSWTILYGSNLWSVPQEIKEKAGILLPCLSGAPCWSRVCTFTELKSLWHSQEVARLTSVPEAAAVSGVLPGGPCRERVGSVCGGLMLLRGCLLGLGLGF